MRKSKIDSHDLKDLKKRLQLIKAKDIMTKDVIATTEDTHLAELAQMMVKSRVSGLPVENKKGFCPRRQRLGDRGRQPLVIEYGDAGCVDGFGKRTDQP